MATEERTAAEKLEPYTGYEPSYDLQFSFSPVATELNYFRINQRSDFKCGVKTLFQTYQY